MQMQGLGMLPGMASAQYLPAQMLGQAGAQQQGLQQQIMNRPMNAFGGAAGLIPSLIGGSGTTQLKMGVSGGMK